MRVALPIEHVREHGIDGGPFELLGAGFDLALPLEALALLEGLEAESPLRVSIERVHTLQAMAASGRRVVGSMASDQCNRCPHA